MRIKDLSPPAASDDPVASPDMPEVRDWSSAVRGKFYRPIKQQLTLRLDADLVAWFKTRSENGEGYQTRINSALRDYVERQMRDARTP